MENFLTTFFLFKLCVGTTKYLLNVVIYLNKTPKQNRQKQQYNSYRDLYLEHRLNLQIELEFKLFINMLNLIYSVRKILHFKGRCWSRTGVFYILPCSLRYSTDPENNTTCLSMNILQIVKFDLIYIMVAMVTAKSLLSVNGFPIKQIPKNLLALQ